MIVPTAWERLPGRSASALECGAMTWPKLQRYPRHAPGSLNPQPVPFVTRSVTGCMPTRSIGTISGEADLMIVPHAPRGNTSQDAPRPLLNVAPVCAQAPPLSTSCARITESSVCAICDAERHGMHANAEHWHDQQSDMANLSQSSRSRHKTDTALHIPRTRRCG